MHKCIAQLEFIQNWRTPSFQTEVIRGSSQHVAERWISLKPLIENLTHLTNCTLSCNWYSMEKRLRVGSCYLLLCYFYANVSNLSWRKDKYRTYAYITYISVLSVQMFPTMTSSGFQEGMWWQQHWFRPFGLKNQRSVFTDTHVSESACSHQEKNMRLWFKEHSSFKMTSFI